MEWEAVRSMANVATMLIALIALALSLAVYRRGNSAELHEAIHSGDKALASRLDGIEEAVHDGNRVCERRLTQVETTISQGINRNDIDKLHHRVNVLVEKVGSLTSKLDSVGTHLDRVDNFLRRQS